MGTLATATAPATDTAPVAVRAGRVQLRYAVLGDPGSDGPTVLRAHLVWDHPTWGLLPADDVWAAAARRHETRGLRRWLLAQACRDAAGRPDTPTVVVPLPATTDDATTVAGDVADALTASGLPAERLRLAVARTGEVAQASGVPSRASLRSPGVS